VAEQKTRRQRLRGRLLPSGVSDRAGADVAALVEQAHDLLTARQQAVRYAEQTHGLVGLAQFEDGPQRFVVFLPGEPVAAFPRYGGELAGAVRHHGSRETQHPSAGSLARAKAAGPTPA
jgi:hypothetical protein